MPGPGEFVKQNIKDNTAGKIGKGFLAFDVAALVTSNNKLKAMWQLMKDIIFLKPIMAAGFIGLFSAMGKSIRSLVHDTGSLEAALKKLSQIQGLQRMFTGLVGGAAAAKLKVAELVNFAATKNIKLGDAGEASRSLLLMTRGSFSGAKALDMVNDAAKATGNSVVAMADAVGEFSNQLRSGGSIESATEALRQMGAISNTTASSLNNLQKNGASAGQIFTTLTDSLEEFHGGAETAAEDLDAINEAYDKARTNLQEKFGSPWSEKDIRNTANMTDAMNAVAPSVAKVSGVLSILFNGFSTAKSAVAKFAAETGIAGAAIEGLTYALTGLAAVASLLGALSLTKWLFTVGSGAVVAGEGILATVGGFVALAASAAVVIGSVAVVAGIFYQVGEAADRAAQKIQELQKSQNQANSAIVKQIDNVRTLTERHEALAKSLDAVTAAQVAYTLATKNGSKEEIDAAEAALAVAQKAARRAERKGTGGLQPVEEKLQADRDRVKREVIAKEEAFQAKLGAAKPEQQAKLLAQHGAEAAAKAKKGEVGERARIKFAEQSNAAAFEVTAAEKKLESVKSAAERAKEELRRNPQGQGNADFTRAKGFKEKADQAVIDAQKAVEDAKKRQTNVGLKAATGSSVQLEAAQRAMLASTDKNRDQKAAALGLEAERARANEAMRGENELQALKDANAAKAVEREIRLNKLTIERGLEMQQALVDHDSKGQQRIKDLSIFVDKYQELVDAGFDPAEAAQKAGKFSDNAISLSGDQAQMGLANAIVGDSLTRIGGGGGVYEPGAGADPMLTLAQRTNELHQQEVEYLKELTAAGKLGVL